ncbi:COX15/CtaA family protein [Pseudonocardia sp. KRD-184]|uniref:COX15/CtaA family protein n=2 Tax=Pseudonocardia oceani TaxID=2792013 RepID=A0ABS6UJW3_9PSEU|nr:COX15/CtaA family protein [Pseudonocardia oceani]MBW0098365.1 COX15/CtaA family protein [Pseudonocardia oceani]MBW0109532.1 COX15/CtaA family protein [Pseudonocardia oceani]MBW0121564.1 COX15/CtaA family protein [Pseudonocardia oceani]MBW0132178.1 COX15/CtaA family protein [Pseudonocardia oceani]
MVTGVTVRVTGSGLGCPGWPECFPGSMVPVSHADVAPLHQWVEFGNRMLTFVLVVIAALVLLAALGTRPRRRRLTLLAAVMPAGIVAQAVIGGITVLTDLAWGGVSLHFMVSAVLVWLSAGLVRAAGEGDGPALPLVPGAIRGLVAVSSGVLAALLVAGTLVTAAGPHAGDSATPRLGLGVEATAQLHAELLFGYLGLLVGLGFALHAVGAPAAVVRRFRVLLVVVLSQGALGGIQYAIGVPEVLVVLHVLGAGLVTAAAAALWFATVERSTAAVATRDAEPALAGP